MINLAVVLGLMPVTGITLPLFSYGGSSLLGTWIGLSPVSWRQAVLIANSAVNAYKTTKQTHAKE